MPYADQINGWRLVGFADTQTSLTGGVTYLPAAADAFRLVSFSIDRKAPFGPRQDAHGTPGRRGQIAQHHTATFSLEFYATGGGATGTAPDWANIVTAGGWSVAGGGGDTTVSGSGSTTTVVDVVDASGISVDEAVVIGGQLRRVTAVDTASTPDNITVTPALSSAPANAATVGHALTYTLNPDRASAGNELTLWRFTNRNGDMLIGAVITSITLTMSGGDEARISVEGSAAQHRAMVSTTLSAGIDNSTTTIPLTDGNAIPSDVSASAPVYMQVDSEVLEIIAISGDTATSSARGVYGTGGAAASHDSGDEVFAYYPTGTYVSANPIARTTGELVVDSVDFQNESTGLSVDLGVRFTEASRGSSWAIDHYTLNRWDVTCEAQGSSYYDKQLAALQSGLAREQIQTFAQSGNTAGSLIAWECPSVTFDGPSLNVSRDDEATVSLSGVAHEQNGSTVTEVYLSVG
jgi:hypothetical protein